MSKAADPTLSVLRVLVAEDEAIVAMLIEDMLKELGADVVGPVKTVDEAMGALRDDAIDVAMLDVNLRGGRAYAVASELHRRSIPFVFVSGYSHLSDCPPELGHVPHLNKPFRLEELVAALKGAMAEGGGGPGSGPA